jgi:hypothetical protein
MVTFGVQMDGLVAFFVAAPSGGHVWAVLVVSFDMGLSDSVYSIYCVPLPRI